MKIYFLNGTSHWTIPQLILGGSFLLLFYISIKYKEWLQKIKDWFK
jgi:hypothetical protein